MRIDNPHESLSFHLIHSVHLPIILGNSWLVRHNPHIDWSSGKIMGWYTLSSCLRIASSISASTDVSPPAKEEEMFPDLARVPAEYLDLKEVFSKARATSLPPHCSNFCSIDLITGSAPPCGRLYSPSPPERQAMENYIQEYLAAGLIRPSSFPAGAGFFFVGKKDDGLRPCIDCRSLNSITIKNCYPLPSSSSAFELLQGATIFSKLDLCSAYHLVHIEERDSGKQHSTP